MSSLDMMLILYPEGKHLMCIQTYGKNRVFEHILIQERCIRERKALNNGLLVNPHDQQSIANALLKLLSEKNLWVDCRKNGWKNIHLFSWPEHCRTYLTRVAACA
ncbi:hypothetical protein ACLB2K_054205 [Fragaria x ananassa]